MVATGTFPPFFDGILSVPDVTARADRAGIRVRAATPRTLCT
jgi:hypothetical protein